MNHGAMLWGAALYNNGGFHLKNYRFGQAYGADGAPLRLEQSYTPSRRKTRKLHGILPFLDPLPALQPEPARQHPAHLRKRRRKTIAARASQPWTSRPANRCAACPSAASARSTAPIPFSSACKRRGCTIRCSASWARTITPGDYRSSGCSACHVVYANDRSPTNSGWWSKYGHQGLSFSEDPTIPKNERGHPIMHQFTRSIPSSQCMNCHMHQGNLFVNPYLGYTWWDQETDGEFMYPKKQTKPDRRRAGASNAKQSGSRRRARTLGRPGFSRQGCGAESEAEAHAVRRLPRPRLGLPRRLQERSQRQSARPATTTKSRTTIRRNSRKRSI